MEYGGSKESKKRIKGAGRVAFLALADVFQGLLNKGHNRKEIYDIYAPKLGICYDQFCRYVNRYLDVSLGRKKKTVVMSTPGERKNPSQTVPNPKEKQKQSLDNKFHWDPIPNKEELF